MMVGTEVADRIDETTIRDTVTGIQVIATSRGTTGVTEVNIGETVGRGHGLQGGGRDLGTGIMGDGDGLRRERKTTVTLISVDGQIIEQSTQDTFCILRRLSVQHFEHPYYSGVRLTKNTH